MEERQLKNIEFDKIRALAADCAFTAKAKSRLLELAPYESRFLLNEDLTLLDEAVRLALVFGRAPLFGYREVSNYVQHAAKGGVLRNEAFMAISEALKTAKQLRRYLMTEENPNLSFPHIEEIAEELRELTPLSQEIDRIIISDTEISDTASAELSSIRRRIRSANSQIKDKLNSMITSGEKRKYLQEALVTIRNGRYVVPVKSESKANVEGIVHDSSSSGLTLYIEPTAVVNLNNALRELEIEEAREIDRILKELSERLAGSASYILNNEKRIIDFDFLFAKAEYAIKMGHSMPEISDKRHIILRAAFHPLIERKSVVPSDILIGDGYRQIVITGPNTGGKTVTLKTIGLCCIMAQSGMFIPAASGSVVCMLDNVFADIGDEQSIAQSLSTFSSHMKNIVMILSELTENSLVLLDEVGAGTDPSEGAALAWVILKRIKDSGSLSLATTHYNEIKQYALTESDVTNASMEFDVERLMPTYRFNIGIPGKSNAFEISRRLGLREDMLEEAESLMHRASSELEDVISELEAKLAAARNASEAAAEAEHEAKELRSRLSAELEELNEKRGELMSSYAIEAKNLLNDARTAAKELMSQADRYAQSAQSERSRVRDDLNEYAKLALDEVNEKIPTHALLADDEPVRRDNLVHVFKKGEDAYAPDIKADCIILDIEGDYAYVQVGVIKTKLPLSKLQPKKQNDAKKSSAKYFNTKAMTFSPRLDIRGITATEVAIEVDKFLDDAILAGVKTLTIVHGKGNGILRKEVSKVLRSSPSVESSRIGGLKEGGEGATIVYLK